MAIEFQHWPAELAARYRDRGYWLDKPLTRGLEEQSFKNPNAPAIICGDRQFTYSELNACAENLAGRLSLAGFAQGDTALVQLPNIAEFYIVFFALLKIGVVPVNALYSHRQLELTSYINQIKPRLIIASHSHELFKEESFINAMRNLLKKPIFVLLLGGTQSSDSLESWIADSSNKKVNFSSTRADNVAVFQLSGGSTGTPKLVPRTHNDYDYSIRASANLCQLGSHTRFLCALPVQHNFVMSSPGALGVFHAGGCVVLARNPEPLTCFDLIREHNVDIVALVPSAVVLWIEAALNISATLPSLKIIQVGGANFAPALARQVPEIFACKLQQVFGMAEGLVNYTRIDDPDEIVFTTQGRPLSPDDEIRIIDSNGEILAEGMVGMLATRGPYTFRGYYKSPEHNRQVFDKDGFYYSGDLVQLLANGYLRVVGRVKDQINRGGEKIASEEIENLLLLHEDVVDAALVAIEDANLGEKSCAFIVKRNCELKASKLRQHLLALGIAEYKLPDRIRFIENMPLTAVGKIDKKELRKQLRNFNC